MKKIGFVDYYISEWHANSYPAWIKEACEKLGAEYEACFVWAEKYVSPVDGRNTDEWCRDFGAVRCKTIAELCERSDVVMILAPSNPETHLGYAEEVLKYGKRTYIDKTFAPDSETAKKIFELGEKYGASFFSSSALRYSDAVSGLENIKYLTTYGGGSNFDEYAVHQAEMVIASMKSKPVELKAEKQGCQYIVTVRLEGEKEAVMVYSPDLAFSLSAEGYDGKRVFKASGNSHFPKLLLDIVRFFETGEVSFDCAETISVMKLRECAIKATQRVGEWIKI